MSRFGCTLTFLRRHLAPKEERITISKLCFFGSVKVERELIFFKKKKTSWDYLTILVNLLSHSVCLIIFLKRWFDVGRMESLRMCLLSLEESLEWLRSGTYRVIFGFFKYSLGNAASNHTQNIKEFSNPFNYSNNTLL